jgi:hypothetical protein
MNKRKPGTQNRVHGKVEEPLLNNVAASELPANNVMVLYDNPVTDSPRVITDVGDDAHDPKRKKPTPTNSAGCDAALPRSMSCASLNCRGLGSHEVVCDLCCITKQEGHGSPL